MFAFDPFTPGFTDDPYPHYAALRATAPAYEHPLGFWIISRYEDVSRLQRSAHSVDEQHLTRLPRWKSDSGALGKENRMMRGLAILDADPPDHTRLRRLLAQAFTRGAAQAIRPRIEALVDEALNRIAGAGRADVVAELAFPLPFTVISEILGIPVTGQARIRELTGTLALGLEPLPDPGPQAAIRSANEELTSIVRDVAITVRGERIPAGSWVLAALAAANRDQEFWGPDADDLRLDRPNAHLNVSFGAGAHHCLGAGLARLEAQIAFAGFARRFPAAVVEDVRWNGRINVRGPAMLTVAVR